MGRENRARLTATPKNNMFLGSTANDLFLRPDLNAPAPSRVGLVKDGHLATALFARREASFTSPARDGTLGDQRAMKP
jgi:hypothetical protein